MKHSEETIKAAEEYAVGKSSAGVFQKAHIDDFLAGAEYERNRIWKWICENNTGEENRDFVIDPDDLHSFINELDSTEP